MKRTMLVCVVVCLVNLAGAVGVTAQNGASAAPSPSAAPNPAPAPATASMLRLIKFSGSAADAQGRPLQGTEGVTFALYADQQDGSPLWLETQNVTLDAHGHYTALLGATQEDGLPLEIFASGEARWLGVQVQGQAEQPRVLLVAVPYALKAAEAETLSGKKASDFVTTEQLPEQVQKAVEEQQADNTTTPSASSTTTSTGTSNKAVTTSGATNFTDTTSDQVVKVTQNGTGYALLGVGTNSNGLFGATQAPNSNVYGIFGQTIGAKGGALIGFANSTTGTAVGVQGVSKSAQGTAGAFVNTAGGRILLGRGAGNAQVISIGGNGSLTLDGSTVGGSGGWHVEQNATSPNIIGGYSGNTVGDGITGATIGGGGQSGSINQVTQGFGTVGGGGSNTASGGEATVSGGFGNTASGGAATVGGGESNTAGGDSSSVGGGSGNTASDFSTVGGGDSNVASGDTSTVGGGGSNAAGGADSTVSGGQANTAGCAGFEVSGPCTGLPAAGFATVGGGSGNFASGQSSTIAGGLDNTASADFATIGGGGPEDKATPAFANRVTDEFGTVGGGGDNQAGNADEDATNATFATVAGGLGNAASGPHDTVGGGQFNFANGTDDTVGGGNSNSAGGSWVTVGGGFANHAYADLGTIGGGGPYDKATPAFANRVTDEFGTVGGGSDNQAGNADGDPTNAKFATVAGGLINTASGDSSTVGGGDHNLVSGVGATVPGGSNNAAIGDGSFAAGNRAKALHDGSFVWADSNGFDFSTDNSNEFLVRATGKVVFVTAVNPSTGAETAGVSLVTGSGSWSSFSDRNAKENFTAVDGTALLSKLDRIPISRWNYKAQPAAIHHLGPMAQDFYGAFGLGEDNKHIDTLDSEGVALAAVQALYRLRQQDAAEISRLKAELAKDEALLEQVRAALAAQAQAPMVRASN